MTFFICFPEENEREQRTMRLDPTLSIPLHHSPQFTSFIVLVVGTRGLHRDAAARSPPARLAFAVPTLLPHGALAVSVAQVRTAIYEGDRRHGTIR